MRINHDTDEEGGRGRPPTPYSVAWLVARVRRVEGLNIRKVNDAFPRGFGSGVMLDLKVPTNPTGRNPFLTLDSSVIDLASFDPAKIKDESGELKAQHGRALLDIDISIVRALDSVGLFSDFLSPEGESLAWMFSRPEDELFLKNSKAWARKALDGNRSYYLGAYRFWEIFLKGGVQNHVILAMSEGLPMVSLAFGDYQNTIRAASSYVERYKDEGTLEATLLVAYHETYKASGLSCAGFGAAANELYDKVENDLASLASKIKEGETIPRATAKELDGADTLVSTRSQMLLRERVRSELRPAWPDLHISEWPKKSAPKINVDWTTGALGRLDQMITDSEGQCEPTDYDTLARAALLLLGRKPEGLKAAEGWIGDARAMLRIQGKGMVEGSRFAHDTVNITDALLQIAKGNRQGAIDLRDRLMSSMPLDKRQHTNHSIRAIAALIDKMS